MLEEHLLTSPNRAYLAMCLWHFVQICFANVPQTSDTLITLYAIVKINVAKSNKGRRK